MSKTCAIIVAAGRSTRMGQNKQLISLGNSTVIEYCIRQFQEAEIIDAIVVVTSSELMSRIGDMNFTKIHNIVEGGKTRQESVMLGLQAVPAECDYIAIHDGARPFVTSSLIHRTVTAAQQTGAATPVISVTSTVKQVDCSGKIMKTIDRNDLRLVQTPQVFEKIHYQQALHQAIADQADLTDDCQLFERMGWPIAIVDGSEENIKLTTPTDIALAQIIAQRMDEDENRNRI